MEPSIDARLKALEEKVEKNYQVTLKIRRVQRNAQLFKLFYWVLIILIGFGAFYFIQPYLMQIIDTYTGIQDNQKSFQNFSDVKNLNALLEQFKSKE